ncbi:MAG: hypothetical protein AseanaTS_07350 [Candidatus Pelagadaptatus aseana]|uniref:monovalent cation/H(+) antiporter subunit G n=1 Tax=Candidatus Pelagadaptatus aseana TaxID=3120508 RepID=UPI0039B34618
MSFGDVFTVVTSLMGLFFFAAGSIGLLRFADVFSRLNSLTKADNLGLGLIALALVPQVASGFDALQLIIIWVLVMISGAVTSFLIAHHGCADQTDEDTACSRLSAREPCQMKHSTGGRHEH